VEYKIRFGVDSQIAINLDPEQLMSPADAPKFESPSSSVAESLQLALDQPVNYPPLIKSLVPGDQVAVLLDPDVPSGGAIVQALLEYMSNLERKPSRVTVVLPENAQQLHTEILERCAGIPLDRDIVLHSASDPEQMSFLMANRHGEPVHINRHLTEADFVMPILATRLNGAFGYRGMYTGVYPTFCDAPARQRFQSAANLDSARRQSEQRGETNEVGFSLGLHFVIHVVPGPDESVLGIFAGESDSVHRAALAVAKPQWGRATGHPAQLVIAALGGANQSWDALARLLFSVESFGEDDAIVVICSDLDVPPGRALQRLRNFDTDPDATFHELSKQNSDDALAAALLARLRESHQVFLCSRLDPDLVESFGIGVIAGSDDLTRLCRNQTVAIIEDAQLICPIGNSASITDDAVDASSNSS
jgi:hypothetical protein